jgi:hypothetical protein
MADSRALTIQSGVVQQIANADALIVGDGILTPSGSGNDLTLNPDGSSIIIGSGKAVDSAGALNVGTGSATGVSIGRTGQTSTVNGPLAVTEQLSANGDVDLGNASTDTISMTGQVDTDIVLSDAAARSINVDKSAVDQTGTQLTIASGEGGDYSAVAGRIGGALRVEAGDGGAGAVGVAAGQGGNVIVQAGDGGTANGGPGGNGGNLTADAGVGTSGTNGSILIGTTNAAAVTIGRVGITTTVAGALTVAGVLTAQSTTTFQQNATFQGNVTLGNDGGDTVDFGGGGGVTATGNPTWNFGTGQVDFGGNVDANAGLDVTGTLTVGGIPITQSGSALLLGGTSTTQAPAPVSLTTTERDALTTTDGMFIWNETTSDFQWYDGAAWQTVGTGGGTVTGTGTDRNIATWDAAGTGLRDNAAWNIDAAGDINIGVSTIRGIKSFNGRYIISQTAAAGNSPWFGNTTDNSLVQGNTEIQYWLQGAGTHRFRVSGGTTVAELDGTDLHLGGVDLRVGSSVAATSARIFNADGDTVLGGSAMLDTEKLRVVGDVGIQGNIDFENGSARVMQVNAAAADNPGHNLSVIGGDGGTTTGPTGQDGGFAYVQGGDGGAGTLSAISGNGGDAVITGGAPGADGGSGQGVNGSVQIGTSQTISVTIGGTATNTVINIPDNALSRFLVREGTNEYIAIDTVNGSESVDFGNTTTNPEARFLGTGDVTFSGSQKLEEQSADPSTGAAEGALYTKEDTSGTGNTELYFRSESDGQVYQLTPSSGAQTTITKVANEAIAAGAPVHLYNNGGTPEFREADANDSTRDDVIGLATAAITATSSGDAAMCGEVAVPDAQWDSIPAIANIGDIVYLSSTVGNLSLTAPSPPSTIVRVGWVSDAGGTDGVKVAVNVGTPTRTV